MDMVWYADEVTPGDALNPDNKRKIWAIYLTIVQLGMPLLCDERAWFTAVVIRIDTVKMISGGLPALFRHILDLCFEGATNLLNGVVFTEAVGKGHLVFGKIGMLLEDERAHKALCHMRGMSGRSLVPNVKI